MHNYNPNYIGRHYTFSNEVIEELKKEDSIIEDEKINEMCEIINLLPKIPKDENMFDIYTEKFQYNNIVAQSKLERLDSNGNINNKCFPLLEFNGEIENSYCTPPRFPATIFFLDDKMSDSSTSSLTEKGKVMTLGGKTIEDVTKSLHHLCKVISDKVYEKDGGSIVLKELEIKNSHLSARFGEYFIDCATAKSEVTSLYRAKRKMDTKSINLLWIYPFPLIFPSVVFSLAPTCGCALMGIINKTVLKYTIEYISRFVRKYLRKKNKVDFEKYKIIRDKEIKRNKKNKFDKKIKKRIGWKNDYDEYTRKYYYIEWKLKKKYELTNDEHVRLIRAPRDEILHARRMMCSKRKTSSKKKNKRNKTMLEYPNKHVKKREVKRRNEINKDKLSRIIHFPSNIF